MKKLLILGIRGIPAEHGGFETFAEHLSLYLVNQNWEVTVYCQENNKGCMYYSSWEGVNRVHIPVKGDGAKSTVIFDWKSTLHASKQDGLILTLGYNTAIFSLMYRLKGKVNLFNMDGIEWRREKWTFLERSWLFINEISGCYLGDHLIADHPEIKRHLISRPFIKDDKVTMIAYGANKVIDSNYAVLEQNGLKKNNYAIIIARAEPENSILEIVTAFSSVKRNHKLVVLGNYEPMNPYHNKVLEAASEDVLFLGAIYDKEIVNSLRKDCSVYIHGHRVGGTNPSLVEAMGAGNAILAHDNKFSHWVTDNKAVYFSDIKSCEDCFIKLLEHPDTLKKMRANIATHFDKKFTWELILEQYESLLLKWV